MYQGFYNLASGMLSQSRNLNVISNNMVNLQTPGFKQDKMVSSTFQEEMLYRTGRTNKENPVPLATTSKIKTPAVTHVDYEQGSFEQTDGIYDFAIGGKGFFSIETPAGEQYTRNGSFSVDAEGYLMLGDVGRVMSIDNQPIQITNENFIVDALGNITVAEEGNMEDGEEGQTYHLGTIKIVDFQDYNQLHREDGGMFSTAQGARALGEGEEGPQLIWKALEKSNVNMVDEMTSMMSSQRALQGAAQALKMYDSIMSKSASEVGRM